VVGIFSTILPKKREQFLLGNITSLKFAKLMFISIAQFRAPFPGLVPVSTVLHVQPIQPVSI
jgi:hypothetical protein